VGGHLRILARRWPGAWGGVAFLLGWSIYVIWGMCALLASQNYRVVVPGSADSDAA